MKYDAVLFDLDGTLIDTIALYGKALVTMMREVGLDMTEAEFRASYVGGKHLDDLVREYNIDADEKERLRRVRDDMYIDLLKAKSVWLPYAEETFRSIRNAHTTGIITGSWKSYTDAINECLNIYEDLPVLITADEIHHAMKPDPYGLILAAQKLNVDPKKSMYVGDQAFDIAAAKAAGMTAVLLPSSYTPAGADTDADIVLSDIRDLLTHI